jgi:hypothetical protein
LLTDSKKCKKSEEGQGGREARKSETAGEFKKRRQEVRKGRGEEWPREGQELLKITWLMAQPEVELHWLPPGFRLL